MASRKQGDACNGPKRTRFGIPAISASVPLENCNVRALGRPQQAGCAMDPLPTPPLTSPCLPPPSAAPSDPVALPPELSSSACLISAVYATDIRAAPAPAAAAAVASPPVETPPADDAAVAPASAEQHEAAAGAAAAAAALTNACEAAVWGAVHAAELRGSGGGGEGTGEHDSNCGRQRFSSSSSHGAQDADDAGASAGALADATGGAAACRPTASEGAAGKGKGAGESDGDGDLLLPALRVAMCPSLQALLDDVLELSSLAHRGALGGVWLGRWHGRPVAIKLTATPTWWPGAPGITAAARAARLVHRNLLPVYGIRMARVDEQALLELGLGPVLRPGWGAPRRPVGRLRTFLAAHAAQADAAAQGGASGSSEHFASLTVMPGDLCEVSDSSQLSPARQALASLRLARGGGVVAVMMEYCELGNLRTTACGPNSPFLASPSWPLHVAQRALLRTAREIASGLAALHAAGLAHGGLHPANVLLAASAADRRGFEARLADVGGTSLAAAVSNPLSCGPCMVMLSPEALEDSVAMRRPPADVYAFGMLLYLMAAGEMPYEGQHLVPVLMAVASGEGPQPEWPTGQHDHLARLFYDCIAHKPEDRPSAAQVLARIRELERRVKDVKRAKKLRPAATEEAASAGGSAAAQAPAAAGTAQAGSAALQAGAAGSVQELA